MNQERMSITIWFLCGVILTVYGLAVTISGYLNFSNPPPVKMAYLHLDFWWGLVLLAVGGIFIIHQWPAKVKRRMTE
ncbi:MAG: hypothetical protein V1794_15415 [Candidatus Glassbacteria bacterium]